MENNIPWNIIAKCFRKQATPEELDRLENWMKSGEENKKIVEEIFNVYTVTGTLPPLLTPDKEKAWKRIERYITRSGNPIKPLFEKFKYVAAAVAILLIAVTAFWIASPTSNDAPALQQYTEIVAPLGQKAKIVLPDSSYVWLNSGSSLKYRGSFNIKEREVFLKGEAFFDVKHNKSKGFRVKTGILDVNVYGTAFNVKNYDNDTHQEITVAEGKVGVSGRGKEIRQLMPGEQALLNKKSNKFTFAKTDPEIVSSWKNNELIFDNTPLTEVIKYMERWYGVNITIGSEMKGKHNYTFKIKTESLTEMLEKMKVMTPLSYNIDGKNVKIHYTN
jgi:transmembrane sensor